MYEFKLADLGEGMNEAEVAEWLVKVGDTLKLDQPMVRVETDKALVEIPSPVAGRVSEIRIQSGQTAQVGAVLAVLDTPGKGNGASQTTGANASTATAMTAQGRDKSAPTQVQLAPVTAAPAPKSRVLAAPAVRKLAFELGVDLDQITPSSATGRVSLEDARAYAEHAKAAPVPAQPAQPAPEPAIPAAPPERQPLTGLRKRIAEHMERSWRTVPHAVAFGEIDGGELIALRQSLKLVAEQRGVRFTYIPLLVKLLIPLLKEFPIFNASLDEEKREIVYKRAYHIGVATDTPEGLLVPVLRDADRLTLIEIASKLEKLIDGAQKRTLALPEVSGSTFTLNNVGSFGSGSGVPIINYPEVAILAVGRIEEKAVVQHGAIIARPIMPLTLSFDHRLIDGVLAGKFLARLKELAEHPQQLMLDML
ncbi:MAG TPA: dihydrolipoamide acetyltransferase family protein [Ktedonobacteraceae bacterium]|nr:dihydrolipoamide acetyltransferase family protein [Ktedonobacteraceae bacterium]